MEDLVVFSLLVIGGMFAVRAYLKSKAGDTSSNRLKYAKCSQQFLGFQDIRDNMVKIDNHRYRALVQVEPINYFLESSTEQGAIDTAFRRVIDCFQYDVQFFVGSKKMNIDKNLRNMYGNIETANPKLKAYGNDLINHTRTWVQYRNLLTKVYYIVICYEYNPSTSRKPLKPETIYQQAFQELGNRTLVLGEALASAGFPFKVLDSSAGTKVYFNFHNRDRVSKVNMDDAEKKGFYSLYTTSNDNVGREEGNDLEFEKVV